MRKESILFIVIIITMHINSIIDFVSCTREGEGERYGKKLKGILVELAISARAIKMNCN